VVIPGVLHGARWARRLRVVGDCRASRIATSEPRRGTRTSARSKPATEHRCEFHRRPVAAGKLTAQEEQIVARFATLRLDHPADPL
jgi:hypothetical protein